MRILDTIHNHDDLVKLGEQDQKALCEEIREFLVSNIAKTGGHLASNLGVVELSVALETVFDTRQDRLVFDVGHQSYVHKLLTGRADGFPSLRQYNGMAGFPKPGESESDAFVAGHASSSVSIALGMAQARTLMGEHYHIIALIGDGATTGGLSYEGLNNAGDSKEPLIVILNDNTMSIDHNVGGMSRHLSRLRTAKSYYCMKRWFRGTTKKIPGGQALYRLAKNMKDSLKRILIPNSVFENMGFKYLGPVDGHDTQSLITLLEVAKTANCPVLIHVITQKGRGYLPAEENPSKFHGIGKFDPMTGESLGKKSKGFSDVFGETIVELAEKNSRVCGITAAMPGSTGMLQLKERFPERMFDVGIAEEHAVSMAGGLAKQGMIPVVAVYSTFLQRSYDMILQDVAILNLHVVFAVDRAGLVGEDGETHHGVFDIGFLRQAPGMKILCPGCLEELREMLPWAVECCSGPVALRYPRGGNRGISVSSWNPGRNTETKGQAVCHRHGKSAVLISYGVTASLALEAADLLKEEGISVSVIRLLTAAPLPVDDVMTLMDGCRRVIIVEETCRGSGIREALAWEILHRDPECRVEGIDLGTDYVPHGSLDALYRHCGLDARSVAEFTKEVLGSDEQKKA